MRSKLCFVIVLFLFFNSLSQAQNASKPEKLISLDFKNLDIKDALHYLAEEGSLNLVIPTQLSGSVDLHLQTVSVKKALEVMLANYNLMVIFENHIGYIESRDTFIKKKKEGMEIAELIQESTPLMSKVWQVHYAHSADIVQNLKINAQSIFSKKGFIQSDHRTNQIMVMDTPAHILEINHLIAKMDIPVKQVLIEARLVSIDSDFERELGLQFMLSNNKRVEPNFLSYSTLAIAKLNYANLIDFKLSALEKDGHAEVISSPSLFTLNQQTASIESGEEIPYQEVSESGGTGISFKKAVLSLKVTPEILPGHKILLQMQINQDKPSLRLVLGVPSINTRQIATHVLIKDGQTIVLGGIFETDKNNSGERIPFISKIPLVGRLFSKQNVLEKKRELLIFVTPRIIDNIG